MAQLIIGLVGQAGCGKGTVADFLREQYGAGYYRFSGILKDLLQRLGLEETRNLFIKMSEVLRQAFGEDVLSYAIAKDAAKAKEAIIVVDGIRRLEDIAALEPLPHFKLVAIDAPAKTRYERMKQRGEKQGEKQMTWEQFLAEEKRSTEVTIPEVMKRAWKTLSNAGTKEALETEVRAMMEELSFKK